MKLFLYQEKETKECFYVNEKLAQFSCNHYFSSINTINSTTSQSLDTTIVDRFEDINTPLTFTEIQQLVEKSEQINDLGYGIEKDTTKYQEGMSIQKEINDIMKTLKDKQTSDIVIQIKNEEKNIISKQLDITEKEVEDILAHYYDYWDRNIIANVYDSFEDVGQEILEIDYPMLDNFILSYIDLYGIGQEIVQYNDDYYVLEDGRIVYFYR